MKTVTIEWMHLDKEGDTCNRCASTGEELGKVVSLLNMECAPAGVGVELVETRLEEQDIARSNLILVDGVPLEDILEDARADESSCASCGELTGKEAHCRTLVQPGAVHEAIPARLIREAVCRVAQCC